MIPDEATFFGTKASTLIDTALKNLRDAVGSVHLLTFIQYLRKSKTKVGRHKKVACVCVPSILASCILVLVLFVLQVARRPAFLF